jgi:hypothetical protein
MTAKKRSYPVLELVEEHKLYTLLDEAEDARLEASGVCNVGDSYYVVFDNRPDIARIGGLPPLGHPGNGWASCSAEGFDFEDITYDPEALRFYLLIEAVEERGGVLRPVVEEYDGELKLVDRRAVDFGLESGNKGFEAISYVRRNGQGYLLMMCEGNKCKSGRAGRKPGGGRIQVFRPGKKLWKRVGEIKLPKSVLFEDYAGMEIIGDRIVVVSQASAAIWVGRLASAGLDPDDDGRIYEFPRGESGEVVYCNVEGVAWAAPDRIVAVSDRMKRGDQPGRCAIKDQSLHIFKIPDDLN